ncbi:hypothetical protein AAC387_Pa09g0105 [Persea americana]
MTSAHFAYMFANWRWLTGMFVQRKLLFILALGASSIMQLRVPATMTSRKCERESSWQIPCDTELRHGQYNLRDHNSKVAWRFWCLPAEAMKISGTSHNLMTRLGRRKRVSVHKNSSNQI